jgi:hypothetical protein
MFYTSIEVIGREPKWLISLATPKLRMLIRTISNAFRMPELEGPATAKVGSGDRPHVFVTVAVFRRPTDGPGRIDGWKDRTFPAGALHER